LEKIKQEGKVEIKRKWINPHVLISDAPGAGFSESFMEENSSARKSRGRSGNNRNSVSTVDITIGKDLTSKKSSIGKSSPSKDHNKSVIEKKGKLTIGPNMRS